MVKIRIHAYVFSSLAVQVVKEIFFFWGGDKKKCMSFGKYWQIPDIIQLLPTPTIIYVILRSSVSTEERHHTI